MPSLELGIVTSPPTIGSSDAPVILGLNPWATQWKLWLGLMGHVPRYSSEDKPHQRTGRIVERYVIPALYREAEDVELLPGPLIGEEPIKGFGWRYSNGSPRRVWMHSHTDYTRADDARVVEGKKVRSWEGWGEPGGDGVLPYVAAQCVWHALVVKADAVDVPAFNIFDEAFRIFRIPFEENLAAAVQNRVRDWYEYHILGDKPPAIDGTVDCYRGLSKLHPTGNAGWRQPTATDIALARDLKRVREKLREFKVLEMRIKTTFAERCGDHEGIGAYRGVRGVVRYTEGKTRQIRLIGEYA